jgi:hypothetical protein
MPQDEEVYMGSRDENGKPHDLDVQLETCIEEFEIDREAYREQRTEGGDWGLHGKLFAHAERIAQMLLSETEQLVLSVDGDAGSEAFDHEMREFVKSIEQQRRNLHSIVQTKFRGEAIPPALQVALDSMAMDDRPSKDSLLSLVWERLCISLGTQLVGLRLVRGSNRILHLVQLIVEAEPSDVTLRYLRHVSRCFILGFDAECIILCRGAIDSAFATAAPDSACRSLGWSPNAGYGFTLSQRINAAKELQLIDERGWKAAKDVNEAAKDPLHVDPGLAKSAFTVIRDMLAVVRQLTPSKRARNAKLR